MRKEQMRRIEDAIVHEDPSEALEWALDNTSKTKATMSIPMDHTSRDGEISRKTQDIIKDMLGDIEASLVAEDIKDEKKIIEMMKSATTIVATHDDYRAGYDGLLIMSDMKECHVVPLTSTVVKIATVGSEFFVKPLVQEIGQQARFDVLELSADHFGYLNCTTNEFTRVNIPAAYEDTFYSEYANIDENAKEMRRGEEGPLDDYSVEGHMSDYHGWRSRNDVKKEDAEKFFRHVGKVVAHKLSDGETPIVLVTLPEHNAIFRRVSKLDNLFDSYVQSDPASLSGEELRDRVCRVVEGEFARGDVAMGKHLEEAIGTGKGSDDVKSIARAVYENRVGMIILNSGRDIAGKYDSSTGDVDLGTYQTFDSGMHSADGAAPDIGNDLMVAALREGSSAVVSDFIEVGTDGIAACYRW